MNAVIIGIDGTLANNNHRSHLFEAGDWDNYHAAAIHDFPNEDVCFLIRKLHPGCEVIGITDRPKAYFGQAFDWIHRHNINLDFVLMRPNDDYSKSAQLKINMIEDHFGGHEKALAQVAFIIENHPTICETMRNMGFRVWQTQT